jgi:hypothetical protein
MIGRAATLNVGRFGVQYPFPGAMPPSLGETLGGSMNRVVHGKVEQNGGQVVVPKMAVPTVGYLAYCKDTEGNIFGIFQPDAAAQ